MVGGYCSGSTLPTLKIYGDAGVPFMISTANSPKFLEVNMDTAFQMNAAGIFQDLEISPEGVFAFTGGTIYAVSAADGSPLFPPISGASTPPLYRAGRLYFGTGQGTLAAVDAGTGKRESTLDLKAVASTRPQADGPRILIGSRTGQVFVIYADAMQ